MDLANRVLYCLGDSKMTYIILRDTLGDGLEQIPNIDLCVIDKEQLPEWTLEAAEIIMNDEGCGSVIEYEMDGPKIEDEIVICEILGEIDGVPIDKWIRHQVVEGKIKKSNKEYQEYLRLKEKFEGVKK